MFYRYKKQGEVHLVTFRHAITVLTHWLSWQPNLSRLQVLLQYFCKSRSQHQLAYAICSDLVITTSYQLCRLFPCNSIDSIVSSPWRNGIRLGKIIFGIILLVSSTSNSNIFHSAKWLSVVLPEICGRWQTNLVYRASAVIK